MDFFKKTVTESVIAAAFVQYVRESVAADWPGIYMKLKASAGERFHVEDEATACVDLILAVIAVDMQALPNLFPGEQAQRLHSWVLSAINTPDYSEYRTSEAEAYSEAWRSALNSVQPIDVLGTIPKRLVLQWKRSGFRDATIATSPTFLMSVSAVVMSYMGFWKDAKKKYKIVPAETPPQFGKPPSAKKETLETPQSTSKGAMSSSKVIYFNTFNRRQQGSFFLPCLQKNCGAPIRRLNMEVGLVRALLEYELQDDPTATTKLNCERCGKTSEYDYMAVIQLMPPERRPIRLPPNHQWALLLCELNTDESLESRGFLGERLLFLVQERHYEYWEGSLLSESQFAPSLEVGSTLGGRILNDHLVCDYLAEGHERVEVPIAGVRKNSDIGTFFLPRSEGATLLQSIYPFCRNPSCAHIFGLMYSEFIDLVKNQVQPTSFSMGQGEEEVIGHVVLTCDICGTSRIVDSRTYDDLYRV
jgi:hypothetical protein